MYSLSRLHLQCSRQHNDASPTLSPPSRSLLSALLCTIFIFPAPSWSVTLFDTVPSPSDKVIPAELCRIASNRRYTGKHPPEFPPSTVKFPSNSHQDHLVLKLVLVSTVRLRLASVLPRMSDVGITVLPDPIWFPKIVP
ncbi:hypothetical protein M405DRAFT_837637 [Rhizopogon salebrosus TDB-379]|nr:hypothetical protein M405DRAFT_837637 [Rhizopogon salebrosus TDB-379]